MFAHLELTMPLPCVIGLDEPESSQIIEALGTRVVTHPVLPKILVRDGQLFVQSASGMGFRAVSKVVYHGIFEDDHDFLAGLALWGGPCLPNARAMMDCRLKLPCLVRALAFSRFASPARGYVSPGATYETESERVAKWGNWHCGENKARFNDSWVSGQAAIIEPFLPGQALRVVVIGDQAWQVQLEGDDWLKSIHHDTAKLVNVDPELLADTQAVARGFGLEIAANDYIVTSDGVPHLLEVNHIPNVTRFPEIWTAYARYVTNWLQADSAEQVLSDRLL